MKIGFSRNDPSFTKMLALVVIIIPFMGCAVTPMETHRKGMEEVTEKEYFIPKKPVDRAFIGCAWSKQFGPIENPAAADIRSIEHVSKRNRSDIVGNRDALPVQIGCLAVQGLEPRSRYSA